MMTPPAGCVFIYNTRQGQALTHGTAQAKGLAGADKYGQDQLDPVCQHVFNRLSAPRLAAPGSALLVSPLRSIGKVPQVPDTCFQHIREIGAGAFGKVR
jgi:hypothetical protein